MSRHTIRYRQDGDGWWYEIRDPRRVLVRAAWRAGDKHYAKNEARTWRDNHVRSHAGAAADVAIGRTPTPTEPRS
jgi:hypothetical protein